MKSIGFLREYFEWENSSRRLSDVERQAGDYLVLVTRPVCFPLGINDQVLSVELADNIVEDDTIFYQLQNLFAHLLESKLKYYVPEKFWRCFRLFGQPVNVREQQDAFEFFTQIVDQVWQLIPSLFCTFCLF